MTNAVVTVRLMPASPDVDLDTITSDVEREIQEFAGNSKDCRFEKKPVAFGLQALDVTFLMDEDIGSTDGLEQRLGKLDGVQSVDVTDVRRALG